MRQIATYPHPAMQITVFAWNQKYLIKFEKDNLEQTYKIAEIELTSPEDLSELLANQHFVQSVLNRFDAMQEDFYEAVALL